MPITHRPVAQLTKTLDISAGILIEMSRRHETNELRPPTDATSSLDFSARQPDTHLPGRSAAGVGSFTLSLVPHSNATAEIAETFTSAWSAFRRHAMIASELRRSGWTLAAYTRRTDGRRRGMPLFTFAPPPAPQHTPTPCPVCHSDEGVPLYATSRSPVLPLHLVPPDLGTHRQRSPGTRGGLTARAVSRLTMSSAPPAPTG